MTFEEAMRASGLIPREIVADGKWRRCTTVDKPRHRNGAYCLNPDGRGVFRNWATDSEVNLWQSDEFQRANPLDMAKLEAHKARERAKRIEAMKCARMIWQRSERLLGGQPYLTRKGLTMQGCTGLRTYSGSLVVPVIFKESIISTQSIHEDGTKRFFAGAPVKGGCYFLNRPRAAITCLVEGVATGLAIFQSIPQANVIIAFDAGNLMPVAQRVRPTGSVVVCADNDHATQAKRGFNPGVEKATNVADFLGCGVAYPQGIEGTDYADCLREWGTGAHKRVAREVLMQARYVCGT